MSDLYTERLSDYLDDALEPAARAEVDAHLETCAECAATLDQLRAVVMRAHALGPVEPETDLWAGIAARIGDAAAPAAADAGTHAREPAPAPDAHPAAPAAPVRIDSHPRWFAAAVRLTLPQLAAAGLLIAVLSGGAAWWLLRAPAGAPGGAPVATNDTGSLDAAAAGAFPGEGGYETTIADLERTLERGEGRLDPETVRVLRENLQIIDAAIADSRRALAADPESPYLYRHLNQQMRRKVDLLQQATVYAYAGNG